MIFDALAVASDILESGVDPNATYQDEFLIDQSLNLQAGSEYFLVLNTESWVTAKVLSIEGFQWTSAETIIEVNQASLTMIDGDAPIVTSHNHNTNPSTNIHVNFSSNMDEDTLNDENILIIGSLSGVHSCTYSFNLSSYELTINPNSNFTEGEEVTVTINTSVQDAYGNGLETPYAFTFHIEDDNEVGNVPPTIQITDPVYFNDPTDWNGYGIEWIDSDPDDDADIFLYYDTDTVFENVGKELIGIKKENASDYFYWDTTQVIEGSYYIVARIYDGSNPEVIRYSPGTILVQHATVRDDFEISDVNQWNWNDDFPGNNQDYVNGVPEGAETLEVYIPLRNKSSNNLRFVHATLLCGTPIVDFTEGDNYVNYGNISAGVTKTPDDDFKFRVTASFYNNASFILHLEYEDEDDNIYIQDIPFTYTFPAQGTSAPNLSAGTIQIDDSGSAGDGDGIFESGERINFFVPIVNTGDAACVNPQGIINQSTAWGSNVFSDVVNNYPDIQAGGSAVSVYDYDTKRAPIDFSGNIPVTMSVSYGPDRDKYQDISFNLTVTGAPYMYVEPNTYDFGVVIPGTVVNIPVTIHSTGAANLTISKVTTDSGDTSTSGLPSLPFTVAAGDTQPFNVMIDTTGLNGLIPRTVTVTSNNAYTDSTQTVTITGMIGDGGGEIEIAGGDGKQEDPHLYETSLVYRDNSSGHSQIYLKDLTTGSVTQLTTDANYEYVYPRIYENYVVWTQKTVGSEETENEIILLDLNDLENPRQITSDNYFDKHPRIWGDYVIWHKYWVLEPYYKADIFLYQISTESTSQLTSDLDLNEYSPEIHGNYAVWYDNWSKVYRYNLSSDSISEIEDLESIEDLATYDEKIAWIAWIEDINDYYDVFLYNGGITNISTDQDSRDEEEVTIYGNNIIYLADDNRLYLSDTGGSGPTVFISDTSSKEDIFIFDQSVVWKDYRNGNTDIFFKSLLSDNLAIKANNIMLDPPSPAQGQEVEIIANIQNTGENDFNNVVVRLYEGDPSAGGSQIGSDQTISLLTSGGMESVQVNWVPQTDGEILIFVVVDLDGLIAESNETDNKASKSVIIGDDDDTGPIITNIVVEEYNGDGDGLIEDNEQIQISWDAEDQAGIGSTSCTVAGSEYQATGDYYVIVGPFSIGEYVYTIEAQDGDNSPEIAEKQDTFQVYLHAPEVTNVFPADGAQNIGIRPSIEVTFNISLNPESVNTTSVILEDSQAVTVSCSVSYVPSENKIVVTPLTDLHNSETYTVALPTGGEGIQDENGNVLDQEYSWTFSVEPDTVPPVSIIANPTQNEVVYGTISILGTAWDLNFDHYQIFYGAGSNPGSWIAITSQINTAVLSGDLCSWDTTAVSDGMYTIRLVTTDQAPAGNTSEATVVLSVGNTSPQLPPLKATNPSPGNGATNQSIQS